MNYGIGNVKGKSGGGSAENYFLICALIPTYNSGELQYEINSSFVIDLATQQPVDLTKYDTSNNKYEINIISPSPTGEVAYEGKFLWQSTDNTTTPPTLKGQYLKIEDKKVYQHNITYKDDDYSPTINFCLQIENENPNAMQKADIYDYLHNNGFDGTSPYYKHFATGQTQTGVIQGVMALEIGGTQTLQFTVGMSGSYNVQLGQMYNSKIVDKVILK